MPRSVCEKAVHQTLSKRGWGISSMAAFVHFMCNTRLLYSLKGSAGNNRELTINFIEKIILQEGLCREARAKEANGGQKNNAERESVP